MLDPLGGLGRGLGLRSLEVRVARGSVQSNSCCSLSEAFLVERSSHISPGPHTLQSPAEKKPTTFFKQNIESLETQDRANPRIPP